MDGHATSSQTLERARAALAVGEWDRARELFEAVLEEGPSGVALNGSASATVWSGDEESGMQIYTRAFAQFEREGDPAGAANTAVMLAGHYRIAGNLSVSNGWLGRAKRLLADCETCAGRGWLEIELAKRAERKDPEEAEKHSREAVQIARELGAPDLESCALSHLGLARISRGDSEGGLAILDEALALATGVDATDPYTVGEACCTTLIACERIADPERARDWGRVIGEFIRRRNYMPLSAWCRAVYAGFLIATGRWEDAERELLAALDDADRHAGSNRLTALANLAELRLLQGRIEEAARLLDGIEDRPGVLGAVVRLHIARGELELAAGKIERRLEGGSPEADRAGWASLHANLARVEIARGDAAAARGAIDAMRESAALADRADMRALADVLAAEAAAVAGEPVEPQPLEAAIELFVELVLPLDEGIARLELARALRSDHEALAIEQARAALRIFDRLGAAPRADRAAKLLRDLGAPGRPAPRGGELSKRETEVLALLGAGLSNAEIAERLVISPRTAEHHVAGILRKLELRNRAEAAAYAVREGL